MTQKHIANSKIETESRLDSPNQRWQFVWGKIYFFFQFLPQKYFLHFFYIFGWKTYFYPKYACYPIFTFHGVKQKCKKCFQGKNWKTMILPQKKCYLWSKHLQFEPSNHLQSGPGLIKFYNGFMNNFLKACSQFCNLEETTFQHPKMKYSLSFWICNLPG